ncbi:hypothetical protein [Agarivorans sp. JK6]|uniref:hypothetical protein n=1 Tax=Agarivorans sp. JK6 TaxID=2997426 RepID=UPI00387360BB
MTFSSKLTSNSQAKKTGNRSIKACLLFAALFTGSFNLLADEDRIDVYDVQAVENVTETVVIPIIGAMDSTGLLAGSVVTVTGVGQPQAQVVGFGAYSVNNSYISYLGYFNLGLTERWTMDISGLQAEFMDTQMFIGERPDDPIDVPNDASYLQRDWLLTFRYLLSESHQQAYKAPLLGLPTTHEYTARTVFEVEPFYRSRDFRSDYVSNVEGRTAGVQFTLDHDARNYAPSPNAGHHSYARLIRDWGNAERASYTRLEAQQVNYFDLGNTSWTRQQSLSLTAYISDIPTWDKNDPNSQPAWFAQSVLGGGDRMRGYADDYFNDRSALFYAAEYRMIPSWQPQTSAPFIRNYNFPWWQFAVFAEMGKVEDQLDIAKLHQNMNWSAGFGARIFIENIVARADLGFSKDDSIFRFTVNQPF